MKAIEISKPGGPEVLQLIERPRPEPTDNEVLIRVAAAGVNRPDVMQRMGQYPPPQGASELPGLEVAGTIEVCGSRVTGLSTGDPVCALLPGGGYAQYAVADPGCCLPLPAGLTMIQAAGIPETTFTVWANLFDDARLSAGESVLIHGGTSGIGSTAIAISKALGATVIASAGSDTKVDAIKTLGANHAFNYNSPNWEDQIEQLGGADVVLDITGGDFVARNLAALNPGGRHVSIAFLRGSMAQVDLFMIMRKRLRLTGSTLRPRGATEKSRLATDIKSHLWRHFNSGAIKPQIDKVFTLADAANAHRYLEAGEHLGKIILDCG